MRFPVRALAIVAAALGTVGVAQAGSGCLSATPGVPNGQTDDTHVDTAQHGLGGCGISKYKRHLYRKHEVEAREKQEMAMPNRMGGDQTP